VGENVRGESRGDKRRLHRTTFNNDRRGDKILLIVETPGARQETVEIIVTERAIRVEAKLDEERVRRALGSIAHARRLTTMKGEYRLPHPVDPTQVKVEKRGSKVYIWIPKLQPT
jgi:HSP20 family molecular chaperone IbpA